MAKIFCNLWNSPILMDICLQILAITDNATVSILVTCVHISVGQNCRAKIKPLNDIRRQFLF